MRTILCVQVLSLICYKELHLLKVIYKRYIIQRKNRQYWQDRVR